MLKAQTDYLRSGCLGRSDKMLSLLSSRLPFRKNAKKVASLHQKTERPLLPAKTIQVNPYIYNHPAVLRISGFIQSVLYHDILGAYVHGSAATDELIPYSDFDGLLIIKDEVLSSPQRLLRFAHHLSDSEAMMLDLDPLQHHGWLLISESDLNSYDSTLFPPELFENAASLTDKGLTIEVFEKESDHRIPLLTLCSRLVRQAKQPVPETLYEIKSILSELMLLPALYVQAVTGKGIYKKFSFETASRHFSADEWKVVESASALRRNWNYASDIRKEKLAWRYRNIKPLAVMLHTKAPSALVSEMQVIIPEGGKLAGLMASKISS